MRTPFDWLGKKIGKAALGACGVTSVQDEITSETLAADLCHEPDPTRETERARLGLLGRLTASLCLLELYGHTPGAGECQACLTKHMVFCQERKRHYRQAKAQAKKTGQQIKPFVKPFLWIIAAGRPTGMLKELRLEPASGWPEGVYLHDGKLYRVGIVVASELPGDRSTLLVRLMAAGPLLAQAITELAALPADAPERAVAEPILLDFQQMLRQQPRRSRKEQEFVMTMQHTWEYARTEGRAEEAARAVLTALRVRGITVPDAAHHQILSQKDLNRLERWLERAIVAASVAEVIDEPS
jgi:hypothetical protein